MPTKVVSEGILAGKTIFRIACGGNHSIALCSDGTLATWGENSHGQLGDGTLEKRNTPVEVSRTGALVGRKPVAVAAGASHTVVLCSDGTVVAWGRNDSGQLGNGSLAHSSTPVAVAGKALDGASLVAVSAGDSFTVALRSDGQVVAWGDNTTGALGNGSNARSTKPVLVSRKKELAKRSVVSVAAGGSHVLAICSDGAVVAWGDGSRGQLGNKARKNSNVPVRVNASAALLNKKPVSAAAGAYHSVLCFSDGTAAAWGANESGQLGDNTFVDRKDPVAVDATGALADRKAVALAAGRSHSLAIRDDRTPLAWGNNASGQLGIGNNENKPAPEAVLPVDSRFTAIAAGSHHAMGVVAQPLSSDSTLAGLSLDKGVMNLDFSPERRDYVAAVTTKGAMNVLVAPAPSHPLARVTVNGLPYEPGAPGVPVTFGLSDTMIVVTVTAEDKSSSEYRINLRPSGNQQMQFTTIFDQGLTREAFVATDLHVNLTLNFEPATGTSLTLVNNTGLNQIQGRFIEFGHGDTVALRWGGLDYQFIANYHGGDGNDLVLEWKRRTVAAWGSNTVGQLGNGSNVQSPVAVPVTESGVLAGKVVLRVFSGSSHTIALCSDGTLAAWGGNSQGQLGDGTKINRTTPVAVTTSGVLNGKTVIAVEAYSSKTRVLCSDGTVVEWGDGTPYPAALLPAHDLEGRRVVALSSGDTGHAELALCSDGTLFFNPFDSVYRMEQTDALSGKLINRIASGSSHFLALCSDGSLVSWGANESGQLGIGSVPGPVPPTLVDRSGILKGKTVVSITALGNRNFVVSSDGTLAAWGSGQLGNGGQSSDTPVDITSKGSGSGKPVISVGVGLSHVLAAVADGSMISWGSNTFGQLGTGATSAAQSLPVVVTRSGFLSGTSALQASAGSSSTAALFAIPAESALASLEVGSGSISPSFSPSTTEYSLSVSRLEQTLTITPKARYPWSTIKVNGVEVASGATTAPITITDRHFIEVTVTGEHLGQTTYRIFMPGDVFARFETAADTPVVSTGYIATGWNLGMDLAFAPPVGTSLTVVRNTGIDFIKGEFHNLAQGQEVLLRHDGTEYRFIANYYGGSGNDLVLEWPDRKVSAWGLNGSGQLGNGARTNSPLPVGVDDSGVLAGKTVVSLSGGAIQSVALCVDGTVATWGGGTSGQLGAGAGVTQSSVPLDITGRGALAGKRVVSVVTANSNSLALCSDGTMVTWGYGNSGQLGNGQTTHSFEPVQVDHTGVLAGKSVVAVSMGGLHCIGICSDGTMVTWGMNDVGQLGNNSDANSTVPVQVSHTGALAGKKAVAVTAGLRHSVALCSDGTLVGWGENSSTQLGYVMGNPNRRIPTVIPKTGPLLTKTVVSLAQGANEHVLALCSDGTMVTWGSNSDGQRGGSVSGLDASSVDRSGVLAGKTVVSVGSGFRFNIATCSDGTVVTWGYNLYGQLGNGTTTNSGVPVLALANGVLAGHKGLNVAGAFHSLVVSAVAAPPEVFPSAAAASPRGEAGGPSAVPAPAMHFKPHVSKSLPAPASVSDIATGRGNPGPTAVARNIDYSPASYGNWSVFEYRRKAAAAGTAVEIFEYTSDMIFWDELEIFPDTDHRVVLGEVDSNGEQTVRIHLQAPFGGVVFGQTRVRAP